MHHEMPLLTALVARTARWVHPDTFRALPVWYPETARGRPIYDTTWTRIYTNTSRASGQVSNKSEPNIKAAQAFVAALGSSKAPNWTVCHIWGVDDQKFQRTNTVIADPRYYSCVGNMVWLPTPLKGFTDCDPAIKRMLRTCAYHLYGWVCEHPDVSSEAAAVRTGALPDGYPNAWPNAANACLPPGTAPFSERIRAAVSKRKNELRTLLSNRDLPSFPRDDVLATLRFWNVSL